MNASLMSKTLLVWIVIWTGTPLAQAFYNSNSGRWLSRDPIEERGGLALTAAFGNEPTRYFDPLGLRLHAINVTWWTLAQIQSTYGVQFLGYTTTTEEPSAIGDDDVREYRKNNGCYCANVFKAKELELIIHSYVPSDPETQFYTEAGRSAIAGHERRRVTVVEKGFDAYFKPSELEGAATKKCNEICSKTPGEAERLLRGYLEDLRSAASAQYMIYNVRQQVGIGREVEVRDASNRMNGLIDIHVITEPPPLQPPECPTSNCPGC